MLGRTSVSFSGCVPLRLGCLLSSTDLWALVQVQSREAPLLGEPSDFHVGYTRGTASPGPPTHGMGSYAPSDGSMTVTSISYPDSPAPTKSYYPGASYSPHYPDEFDHYSAGHPMLHDSVTGMMPNQWARKPYTSTMYMEPASYAATGYGSGAPLVHRPAPSAEPPSSLSLSGFGADLPSTTTPQPGDRLLPNPAIRTPYPSIKSPAPHHTPTGATLADIASAASYVSSFETSSGGGMSYGTSSSSHRSSSSSGAHEPDGLFSEHERSSIQSQGPGLDFGGYTTADPLSSSGSRRNSSGGGGGGGTLANGHTYVPSESMYAPSPHPQYGYGAHHHHRAGAVGSSRGADGHRMASVASRR